MASLPKGTRRYDEIARSQSRRSFFAERFAERLGKGKNVVFSAQFYQQSTNDCAVSSIREATGKSEAFMKLEDEIKQTKPFQDEFQKLEVNLIYTFHWLQARAQERLNGADITLQQYNILRILRGQYPKPATIMLLKERMLDRQCDASRLVERLVQKNLVSRAVCPSDRRKVDVLITQKGLDLLKTLDKRESFLKKRATLTESEAQTLNALLDKMRG
ncbi:MAG: MarR family transcriptional regulator [Chloroherpetonaceae bacterium]|nr:MarR family transcriptional regulator [Chloroherpetonaceae bacterium]